MKKQIDRRMGQDRRQDDEGFPGRVERRRRVEQRKLEIVELTVSETEWQLLFCSPRLVPVNAVPPFSEELALTPAGSWTIP